MAVRVSSRPDVRKRRGHGTSSAVSALPCAHPTWRAPEAAMRSFEPGSRRRLHAQNLKRRRGGVVEQQCLVFSPPEMLTLSLPPSRTLLTLLISSVAWSRREKTTTTTKTASETPWNARDEAQSNGARSKKERKELPPPQKRGKSSRSGTAGLLYTLPAKE